MSEWIHKNVEHVAEHLGCFKKKITAETLFHIKTARTQICVNIEKAVKCQKVTFALMDVRERILPCLFAGSPILFFFSHFENKASFSIKPMQISSFIWTESYLTVF